VHFTALAISYYEVIFHKSRKGFISLKTALRFSSRGGEMCQLMLTKTWILWLNIEIDAVWQNRLIYNKYVVEKS
jgi:hypothetical protein